MKAKSLVEKFLFQSHCSVVYFFIFSHPFIAPSGVGVDGGREGGMKNGAQGENEEMHTQSGL